MPQDAYVSEVDEGAENENSVSAKRLSVHHGYIKEGHVHLHAWHTLRSELSTFFSPVLVLAMFISAALLILYWCPSVLTAPAAANLTAEGWTWKAQTAVKQLQEWYDPDTGLWKTTHWWNSANILTMLGNYALVNSAFKPQFIDIAQTTHAKAPGFKGQVLKVRTPTSMETYTYPNIPPGMEAPPPSNADDGFLNYYYDDEGWWALAWLKAYDVTNQTVYLKEAATIFDDMVKGWGATCGGIWWNKGHDANVAISNELFFAVAAGLAKRATRPLQKKYYVDWMIRQFTWFRKSGLINAESTINDGLDLTTCKNNNGVVWSYNQGVILGAMVEADAAEHNPLYESGVLRIMTAAVGKLADDDGVIHDVCEPDCGNDGPQFKGIFMRNVMATREFVGERFFAPFSNSIGTNAASIWARDRDGGKLGLIWSGPYQEATAATQSSALDALVAAIDAEMHPSQPHAGTSDGKTARSRF